jgi:hypothetical protein
VFPPAAPALRWALLLLLLVWAELLLLLCLLLLLLLLLLSWLALPQHMRLPLRQVIWLLHVHSWHNAKVARAVSSLPACKSSESGGLHMPPCAYTYVSPSRSTLELR